MFQSHNINFSANEKYRLTDGTTILLQESSNMDQIPDKNAPIETSDKCKVTKPQKKRIFEGNRYYFSLYSLQNFNDHIKKFQRRGMPPLASVISAVNEMKIPNIISINMELDPTAPLNSPLHVASFSINENVICSAKGKTKKLAKQKVGEMAVNYLMRAMTYPELIELINSYNSEKIAVHPEENTEVFIALPKTTNKQNVVPNLQAINEWKLKQAHLYNFVNGAYENNKPPSFVLNEYLYESSMQKQFVLYNNLEVKPRGQLKLFYLLKESAEFCNKSFSCDFEADYYDETAIVKAFIMINKEIVATAIAASQQEAKINACCNAVEELRKMYYTIKVKNGFLNEFTIEPSDIFDKEAYLEMISELGLHDIKLEAAIRDERIKVRQCDSKEEEQQRIEEVIFKRRVRLLLQKFSKSKSMRDLIFTKDFTESQRLEIKKLTGWYKLICHFHGKKYKKFSSVRRNYPFDEILEYLGKTGGSNAKFELVDASL